jgi:prepilin-type N-terminal cleavage/methylation domain-containing protein
MKRYTQAFTLIELLVVIGIIGALAAGVGLALKDGSPAAALRSSQGLLSGLIAGARGQAAINQADAMIIVEASDPTSDSFLRELRLVYKTSVSPERWRPVGDAVLLPRDIYVVPPADPFNGIVFSGTEWGPKRRSSGFTNTDPVQLIERDPETGPDAVYTTPKTGILEGKKYLCFQPFTSSGQLLNAAGTGAQIIITIGKRTGADIVTLDNPEAISALRLSRYGVPALINESSTLDATNP